MMTPEQRLDRVERILTRLAVSGREARSEFRQKINILIDMHIQSEEQRRAQSQDLNGKINVLIQNQVETNDQIKGLASHYDELRESQKLTDKALRNFIDSLREGRNGKSSK